MNGRSVPGEADRDTLRRASLRVAVRISAACGVLVLCLLAAATVYLMNKLANPDLPGTSPAGKAYTYLDSKDLIEAMIIAGVTGVVLAGVVGWLSARSAIRPLGEALALQRQFVQDASHELRTPLAILDARIQLAQRDAEPDSTTGRALGRIRADTGTLTGIVNELLVAATGAAPDPTGEPTDLADVAGSVAESLQDIAAQQDIRLTFSDSGRPEARIDPSPLRRAVLALAENALAHTPPGGTITISTAVERNQAAVYVADTGPGITGVDQARIFDRFVRTAAPAAPQGRRSFGIGLALVREIAAAAGGTVEVARSGPAGTTMKLLLPLVRQ
ncbi:MULTISPECIES: HAMP domain-containing sensor histidine kinase [unclassified Arthrobacter]|uniref:sensor histidine kinase n=1 Tax=unclassified Arthrobacter TaxID=235627 RepID=UPI001CFFAD5F|nr:MULTISPECIES: HAMP domain-containing sensor histidine kinase [unclassified Arthrobacter]MCB5282509.1 Signal transduction histidine-protein kinase ArlS [Arthrobacter sp. ES1]WGZ81251.1 HAMP domain-containing sensor histidine kinase [Arthrobacter sp. EM1]